MSATHCPKDGAFIGEDGRCTHPNHQTPGKVTAEEGREVRRPPQKITPKEARRILERGVDVTDVDGRKVRFGKRLLMHYRGKPEADVNGRLASLDYALDAVRTVKPIHNPRGLTDRDLYIKPIADTNRAILVLVDTTDDVVYEVFDVYRKRQPKK